MKDIKTPEDIRLLVDSFYSKVSSDPLLGPVFNDVAAVNWQEHLPVMYRFWGTQLIGTGDYKGQPFPPHMRLKLSSAHFNRWVSLFVDTVQEHFQGLTAEIAIQKARNIAGVFQFKLNLTENQERPQGNEHPGK